jgi:hypothetical protein
MRMGEQIRLAEEACVSEVTERKKLSLSRGACLLSQNRKDDRCHVLTLPQLAAAASGSGGKATKVLKNTLQVVQSFLSGNRYIRLDACYSVYSYRPTNAPHKRRRTQKETSEQPQR